MSFSKKLTAWLLGSLLGSSFISGAAQADTNDEKALTVTATRFASSIDTAPVNVTVISSDQIRNSSSRNLGEILELEAGIHVQHRGNTGGTVDLAGFGETRGQNTLILINGRRINDVDLNGANLDSIPLDNIARVEIVRGSATVLYGDNATGGVINIVTRSGLDGNAIQLRSGIGSWNTLDIGASLRARDGRHGISIAADAISSDGYRDYSAYQHGNVNGEYAYETAGGAVTGLRLMASDQDSDLPGSLHEPIYKTSPDSGTSLEHSTEQRHTLEAFFNGSRLSGELSSHRKKQTYTAFGTTEARLSTTSFTPRLNWDKGAFRMTGGADLYLSTLATDADFGIARNQNTTSRESMALYLAPEFRLGAITLGLGGRYQKVALEMENTDVSGGSRSRDEREDDLTAADVNLGWQISRDTHVHLRGARSFRFPVLDEMWSYFSGTISFLEPQTSDHVELGLRLGFGAVKLEGELFDIRVQDEIAYDAASFANVNLDDTRHRGADLRLVSTTWVFGSWRPGLNIGYRHAEFDGGVNEGNTVPLIPELKGSFSNRFRIGEHNELSLNAVYTGTRYFGDDNGNAGKEMPAHTLYDLGWRYSRDNWRMKLDIRNLLDRTAADSGYYTTWQTPPYAYYPLNGRNYRLSIESSF